MPARFERSRRAGHVLTPGKAHLQLKMVSITVIWTGLICFLFFCLKKKGLALEECTLFKQCLEGADISSTLIYFLVIYC